jgi:hypothetical protein
LKQTSSASDFATEFRIISSELEWDDAALMAAFRRGLKPFVRAKLIEHTIGRSIRTLEELITTASLIDNTLFEARRETQAPATPSSSTTRPLGGKTGGFVGPEVREKRRKAGQCPKCGDSSHAFEKCTNGWTLKPGERAKPAYGKAANLIDLEEPEASGKA